MGIVAFCPNHHRVKVKDELAGKRGICPTCGARFRIPLQSQPMPAAGRSPLPEAGPAASRQARSPPLAEFISLDADLAATLPRVLPLARPGPG